ARVWSDCSTGGATLRFTSTSSGRFFNGTLDSHRLVREVMGQPALRAFFIPHRRSCLMTFPPGKSGNPNGRPPGSRNKATVAAAELLDGEAEAITRPEIEKAKKGDISAFRLCLARLVSARKDRAVTFELPPINTPADAPAAMAAIAGAVAAGDLTPSEAAELSKVVE